MTAGQKARRNAPQLLLLLLLLLLTEELGVRGQEDESAALHHLRGTSGWEGTKNPAEPSLMTDQLFLHNHEDIFFWGHFEGQTVDGCPPSVSEISASFRQKPVVRTGRENFTEPIGQEHSQRPPQSEAVSMKGPDHESCGSKVHRTTEVTRFGRFSEDGLDGDSSTEIQQSFIQDVLIRDLEAVLDRQQQNQQVSQLMDQPDPVSWYQSPQRAADPVPQFDHQQILMLQDDHVVQSAAAHLYDQHPSVSSVHVLDQNQRPKQVRGQPVPLSENSSLVLVGHGARDGSGQMRVSGFTCGDVARIIQSCSRTGHRIRTTTVVACDVGSDEQFVEDLLKKLHEAGVQTELHLWKTLVQVTETGKIISQEVSPDGPEWRHEDSTKKVVLTVGRNGEVRRPAQSDWRGQTVFTNNTNFLQPAAHQNLWPKDPKLFIDPEIYKNIDQNHVDEVKNAFELLESFSWGLFHPDQPKPQTVQVNNPGDFLLGVRNKNQFTWTTEQNELTKHLMNCYVIRSGTDMRNIIRHFAKDREKGKTFLMINNWIFLIEPVSLYVFPAGKQIQTGDDRNDIKKLIEQQGEGSESYTNLRNKINEVGSDNYGYYVRSLFLGEPDTKNHFQTEFFYTWYFTASCIAESARNFRTFPLILMSLFMDEKFIEGRPDFWFNQHPMARGGSWIHKDYRGFRGSADPNVKVLTGAQREKLVEVLKIEYLVFKTWQNAVFKQWEKCKDKRFLELKAMNEIKNHYLLDFIENCKTFLETVNNVRTEGATGTSL